MILRQRRLNTSAKDLRGLRHLPFPRKLVQRVCSFLRIDIHLSSEIESIVGEDCLHAVTLRNRLTGLTRPFNVPNLFVMIGADPNTAWLEEYLALDHNGFIRTGSSEWEPVSRFSTNCPGVFAVGDVRAGSVKRVASAVGEGSVVISDIHQYLEKFKPAGLVS